MTHIVADVSEYDDRRYKVTLDEGAVAFLLYKGELRQAGIVLPKTGSERSEANANANPGVNMNVYVNISVNTNVNADKSVNANSDTNAGMNAYGQLSDGQLQYIYREILLPRARKRVLYYLKNGDKTEFQIRRKLAEGLYPAEVTEQVLEFLRKYRLTDDSRLLEASVNGLRGKHSRREIEAKLYAKGLSGEAVREALGEITGEEEAAAAAEALRRHCSGNLRKDYAYLARKGFPPEAVRRALEMSGKAAAGEEVPEPGEFGC